MVPMRITLMLALACAVALTDAALAQSASVSAVAAKAPGARMAGAEVSVRARVVELDRARRLATLKGPKGNVVTLEVPAEVKNFDQVRVGDELVVRYMEAIAARIEPASKSGIRERIESTGATTAAAGAMPGVATERTVEVVAVISALDSKAGTATLRGAKRTVTVKVPDGIDVSKLKVGDEVHAVMVEAVVLNVERVAPAVAPAR
jgi:hypothetical protein